MTKEIPFITVLMPVYNGTKFLGEAIESIVNQSFNEFEFLIINDGSTDQSNELIKSYDDKRIRLFVNKNNIGQSASLNKGIKMARGDYIAIMDQDDISVQDRLKVQLEFMENHPNIDVCGSWLELFGTYDGIVKYETKSEKIKMGLLTNINLGHPTVIIRKSTIDKYNLRYDDTYTIANDYDLWFMMLDTCSFSNISKPLLKHRTHERQNSKLDGDKTMIEGKLVLGQFFQKIDFRHDEDDLDIHYKIFTGNGLDSLSRMRVFRYLRRLQMQNHNKKIFKPDAFNEFIRLKWRRFLLNKKSKLLYWVSSSLFFGPIDYLKSIQNHFFNIKRKIIPFRQ